MHPLTARLLAEITHTGDLSPSSWNAFLDTMSQFSDAELGQICFALGAAKQKRPSEGAAWANWTGVSVVRLASAA